MNNFTRMRKIAITILVIAFFKHTSQGQTTQEEYNYVSKGYSVQIESGLDMKKGYEITDLFKKSTNERTAELKVLYRLKGASKQIAAYMLIYTRVNSAKEYICIPNPKSSEEILKSYWNSLYSGNGDSSQRLQLISFILSQNMVW